MTKALDVPALSDFSVAGLAGWLEERGYKTSHAQGILRAYFQSGGEMASDRLKLGSRLARDLREGLTPFTSRVARRHESMDGTIKLLLAMRRGGSVETVLMPAYRPDRAAVCVSSQVGCAMGCDFCASTREGLERNLTGGEIVEQFLHQRREAGQLGRRIASMVFMGMGEPMHNLPAVVDAIRRISDDRLGALGRRGITVSTVGVVPGIEALMREDLGVHLALSLHAPDDETRSRLVPMNRRWKVTDVLASAKAFFERTGRIVTIEYCMLAGVNDSDAQASLLAERLRGFRAHVNLIPYNTIGEGISGMVYETPTMERMRHFAGILSAGGVVTHFRRTRGDDVNAACGQLRQSTLFT